ncbi:MAG: hypothetical protein HQL35_09515 [Alphaproteobacteria bacterium]|nr:hypothetical protein [Alphaproteobacteria bacterium]
MDEVRLIALAIFSCGIFGSVGIVLFAAANNVRLVPCFTLAFLVFSATVGLAIAAKMTGMI